MSLPVALVAAALEVSCGNGIHDANEEASMTQTIDTSASHIDFMGGRLDICEGCVRTPGTIQLTWRRSIPHKGALSAVYELEVPSGTFQRDPTITISTTPDIAGASYAGSNYNVIGSMVPVKDESKDVWVPNTSFLAEGCPSGTVCGPVQSQVFSETNVLRLAIVTQCYKDQATPCPAGQGCYAGDACQ